MLPTPDNSKIKNYEKYKKSAIAFCFLLAFVACRKDEKLPIITTPPPGLGGDSATNTAIDKWLLDSLTNPYNISVLYKYSPWNTDLYYNVTPVQEDKIIPFFSALNRTWIVPYNQETGSAAFIKQNCSKQLVLIGSVEYDAYTVKLGQAEGGNNIVFFDVNQHYDTDPVASIQRVIHTAHHEFGHNLNQRIAVSPDFQGLSSKGGFPNYTATWFNISDATALTYGYPTAYAMASADEDFVEMLSVMLVTGKPKWDEMKASVPAAAAAVLQQKEDFVVKYMLQAWNIDFYSLQRRVQAAINALFPIPTVDAVYGFGKTYTTARMNPTSSLLPQSAGFTSIFNTSKTAVAAIPSYGLVLDSMAVITSAATTATVRCYLHQGTATTVFFADFTHTLAKDAGGLYSYTYVTANGNGTIIKTAVTPLLNYFVSGKFAIDWYADPSVSAYPRVKFTPQATPASYFIARLFP